MGKLAYVHFYTIKKCLFEPFNAMSKTPYHVFIYNIVDELAVMRGINNRLIFVKNTKFYHLQCLCEIHMWSFCSIPLKK